MRLHRLFIACAVAGVMASAIASVQAGDVTSKFDIDVYGYIKLDAVYDSQENAVGDIELFVPPEGASKDGEFTMTARQTRFGLNIHGPDAGEGRTSGRIEAGFWGEEVDPDHKTKLRLRLAYADLTYDTWSLRAGQDWDTFISVIPKSLNFTYFGWQGAPGYRRAQLRLSKSIAMGESCKVTTKVAAARTLGDLYSRETLSEGSLDGDGNDDGNDSEIPSFQANIGLSAKLLTEKPTRISVSGLWGQEDIDKTTVWGGVTNTEVDAAFESWLVMGSLFMPVTDTLALQGAIWQGENLDAYEAGLGLGVNMALNTEIAAEGGWVQLMYTPSAKWNMNLGYGVDDPDDDDLNVGGANSRSKNEFTMGSVYYSINEAMTFALEVSHLTTSYKSAADAENDRVHGAVFYFF